MAELTGKTMNIAQENMEQLKVLFPDVFVEGKVDFDKLRQVLGDYVDESKENYSFVWNGKRKALKLAQTPTTGTLRPCKEESMDWETTQNVYIEGDNLEVLKLLQKSYFNKVKMIYIDPPYNTGKDFVYKDDFHDSIQNYKEITGQVDSEGNSVTTNPDTNGRYHTDWLNMMYPRLRLARNLLTEDGVIFISIDDNEVANLKKICDEIFGEDNFVASLIIQTATDNNKTQINIEHEYMLCYAKNKNIQANWEAKSEAAELLLTKYNELLSTNGNEPNLLQKELRKWIKKEKDKLGKVSHYDNVDSRGVFHDGDIANTKFGGYSYTILHPITNQPCKIPDKGFRFSEETMCSMIEHDDILFGVDHTILIKPKKRLEDVKDVLRTVIYEDGRTSSRVVDEFLGREVFKNPKSHFILKRLEKFILKSNDIILDFFSGSATTAHAVMQLNAEDGGKRQYIMVQLPEQTDEKSEAYKAGYKNICEIGKERIRRAGEKIKAEKGLLAEGLDIGFKVFKLDSSNIMKWQPKEEQQSLEELKQQLMVMGQVISTGRSELDVVYEIMLKLGYALTSSIEELMFSGKKVYSICAGALFICLAYNITLEIAKEIISYIYIYRFKRLPDCV